MSDTKKNPRYRGWFITANTGAITDDLCYDNMEKYVLDAFHADSIEYFCWDEEQGETGNLHLHIYIELINGTTDSSIRKKFKGCHVEPREKTPKELRDYFIKPTGQKFGKDKKDKSTTIIRPIREWGSFERLAKVKRHRKVNLEDTTPQTSDSGDSTPSKRTLNDRLNEYVELYDSIEQVEDVDLWFAKHYRKVLEQRFLKKKEEALFQRIGTTIVGSSGEKVHMLKRKIYYLYGDTRVGKTFGVRLKYGSHNVYTPTAFDHMWDDYEGEKVINLDEFRSSMPFEELLTLMQGYREQNKLSARYDNNTNLCDTVVVSTNIPIEDQYTMVRRSHASSWKAFFNRFNGGVWEMVYSEIDDVRLISCVSDELDYSPASRKELDFSDPPVDLNDGVIWIKDRKDFVIAKHLINGHKSALPEAIEAEKSRIKGGK